MKAASVAIKGRGKVEVKAMRKQRCGALVLLQKSALEDAIGSHAYSLAMNSVTRC
jgi:hypothetical protein